MQDFDLGEADLTEHVQLKQQWTWRVFLLDVGEHMVPVGPPPGGTRASNKAYLPLVSSPVARNRYTSPTTAMVRPWGGALMTGWRLMLFSHFLYRLMNDNYNARPTTTRIPDPI